MMLVPGTLQPPQAQAQMPSATNLLMAAAMIRERQEAAMKDASASASVELRGKPA
jgi:hypothetical protein